MNQTDSLKVLVLGASGLLGNAVFRVLKESQNFDVYGTIRNNGVRLLFTEEISTSLIPVSNLLCHEELNQLLNDLRPKIVINCVSIGRPSPKNPVEIFSILSLFPRHLAHLCEHKGIYLVQISSDGVFLGNRGNYSESDLPDAKDIYGTAKLLGEVSGQNSVTLRTSIIGPELYGKAATLEWLLSQSVSCKGYINALFSGLTTVELAQILRDIVCFRRDLTGIFHVASEPISKFRLLELIVFHYKLDIKIIPDNSVVINRTLCGKKFEGLTGYITPTWSEMIKSMRKFHYGLKNIDSIF